MNYIPVDISKAEEVFSQGRKLYRRIHPVNSLEEAMNAARDGQLFMKCDITENELDEYFKLYAESLEIKEKLESFNARILSESQIALADKPFKSFELATANGSVTVSNTSKLVAEYGQLENLYNSFSQENNPVHKVIKYELDKSFSKAILPELDGMCFKEEVSDCIRDIISAENLDVEPEVFAKKIGKSFNNRVNKMKTLYGIEKVSAEYYAYMLSMAESWKAFTDMHDLYASEESVEDFSQSMSDTFSVNHSIRVTTQLNNSDAD